MKTAGFDFLNVPPTIAGQITAFNSIDDIIRAPHEYEIYGKTYGANKYDTSLICYAISKLAQPQDHIVLYEYNEKDLKELPTASLDVIRSMGNIVI